MQNLKIAVLTGGPCAHKTETFNELKRMMSDQAEFVNEVACDIVAKNGVPQTQEHLVQNQTDIFYEQILREEYARSRCVESGRSIIICDRGLLDGCAYLPDGLRDFEERFCVTASDIYERYNIVFHLPSLATIDSDSYLDLMNTSPARFENPGQAIKTDYKIQTLYSYHPNFHLLHSSYSSYATYVMGEILKLF